MTNRASAVRERLIHQHQAGTRVLRPVGIRHSGPHYIPTADVARRLQRPRGSMIPRYRPNRRHEWRLWQRRRRFITDSSTCRDPASLPPATEWSYFIPSFSAYSLIRLYHTWISLSRILNRFYNTLKDGFEHNRYIGTSILSKADRDILDTCMATSKNSSSGCI